MAGLTGFCFLALSASSWPVLLAAAGGGTASALQPEGAAHGLDPLVLVGVAVILIAAKLSGELFERIGQPAVLGELLAGILIGNLTLLGLTAAEPLKTDPVIASLAEIGVILLLFEVGLESHLGEMLKVGLSSLLVAFAGVTASFFLGLGIAAYFLPGAANLTHVFIGATIGATSVGITARVLKDMGQLATRESRIILGAAVIDDVLGLLMLAVVSGAIRAVGTGAAPSLLDAGVIALEAIVFLAGAVVVGHYVMPYVFRGAGRFEGRGVLLAISIAFCFLLAWAAARVELAPIIGAFAAGLVLEEAHFRLPSEHEERNLQDLLDPLGAIFVPIFFVMVGVRVDLRALAGPGLLVFASLLTLAAIAGKQLCSLVVLARGVNRLAIGIGMVPRGEVELIFAGIGATLWLPNARGALEPVVGASTFGAVVIVVIITTLVTPPALKWALARQRPVPEVDADAAAVGEAAREIAERTTY